MSDYDDEELGSSFERSKENFDRCVHCDLPESSHFWQCNSCGSTRPKDHQGLVESLCNCANHASYTLTCVRTLLKDASLGFSEGLSDTWPLSWAPPPDRKDEEEWRKRDRESRRKTDRADAPRIVEWRSHRLVRAPVLSYGTCYGFHNVVTYYGPDPFWTTEISCDGKKGEITLQVEEGQAVFSGEGENEQEALDRAALRVGLFKLGLQDIIGKP